MSGSVVVLGAGLVGLACGRALQCAGFDVTLVDRGAPGEGASFGNASHIATASVIPQATPGLARQTLKMLRDPNGPLIARAGYVARHLPWFLRFFGNGNLPTMQQGAVAMSAMVAQAWDSWRPVLRDIHAEHLVEQTGAMHVFKSQAALSASRASYAFRRQLGVASTELDVEAALAMEPALAPGIAGAVHVPGMGYVTDTLSLSQHLVASILKRGGRIERALATSIDGRGGTTDKGRLDADLVVLAAGAWSKTFARQLGFAMPLVSERGYHIMLARDSSPIVKPLLLVERKVAVTPMLAGLRLASVAEFTQPDAAADHDRAYRIFRGLGD